MRRFWVGAAITGALIGSALALSHVRMVSNVIVDRMGHFDIDENSLIKATASGIYHVPGSPYYDRLKKVSEYFQSVSDAENAGYRAASKPRGRAQ